MKQVVFFSLALSGPTPGQTCCDLSVHLPDELSPSNYDVKDIQVRVMREIERQQIQSFDDTADSSVLDTVEVLAFEDDSGKKWYYNGNASLDADPEPTFSYALPSGFIHEDMIQAVREGKSVYDTFTEMEAAGIYPVSYPLVGYYHQLYLYKADPETYCLDFYSNKDNLDRMLKKLAEEYEDATGTTIYEPVWSQTFKLAYI